MGDWCKNEAQPRGQRNALTRVFYLASVVAVRRLDRYFGRLLSTSAMAAQGRTGTFDGQAARGQDETLNVNAKSTVKRSSTARLR